MKASLSRLSVGSRPTSRLSLARWVLLCAIAEGIGMTAAAASARAANALPSGSATMGLLFVVAGGLVEGVAIGTAQALGMRRWRPGINRRRWIITTTIVAGLGWAAASAPAALSAPNDGAADDGATPPILLIIGGAIALGATMGALLGATQAIGLRGRVRHPWRWIGISAAAWAPAMAIIFVGATVPDATWPDAAVIPIGTVTGLAAGAALGLVSRPMFPLLDRSTLANELVMAILQSPARTLLDRSLLVLRVRGALTGRPFDLPVQYAVDGADIVIVPGRPERKRWWRNFERPAPADALVAGVWRTGMASALRPGDDGYASASAAYLGRWPRMTLDRDTVIVVLEPA
jgi:hypothetical protein